MAWRISAVVGKQMSWYSPFASFRWGIVTNLNAANGKAAAERHAGCRQQVFAVLHGKDLYGHVHRTGVVFTQAGFLLSLMCCKDAPRHTACLEQGKTQEDAVAHARPDGLGYVLIERNVPHQHGVDCHADDDEEGLEREGKEASEAVKYTSNIRP